MCPKPIDNVADTGYIVDMTNETSTTQPTYTDTQARAMRRDTQITSNDDGYGQAHVVPGFMSDDDPGFFMDVEWLDWFRAEHPEYTIVSDMVDLFETTNGEYV